MITFPISRKMPKHVSIELVCIVPVSSLDVAFAGRLVFVGFEDDLIFRFAQRRRLWTQIEINVAVTVTGIVVSYSDLLVNTREIELIGGQPSQSYQTNLSEGIPNVIEPNPAITRHDSR